MEINNTLKFDKIEQTIHRLSKRILQRFPDSSLGLTCRDFHKFTLNNKKIIPWLNRPNYYIRSIVFTAIVLVVGVIGYSISIVDFELEGTLNEIVTLLESAINDVVLLGAGIFFLYTFENRWKRDKIIKILNEVRGFAHVVDMHQLTKDPTLMIALANKTESSPKRELTKFELQRYLDYCAEFLSLIGKVAAVYSQSVSDEVIVQSSGEIENLCSNMANKVWQKLEILQSIK